MAGDKVVTGDKPAEKTVRKQSVRTSIRTTSVCEDGPVRVSKTKKK